MRKITPMIISNEQYKILHELVVKNDFEGCFNFLDNLDTQHKELALYSIEISNLRGRWNKHKKEEIHGILANNEKDINLNRIRVDVLALIELLFVVPLPRQKKRLLNFEDFKKDRLPEFIKYNGIKSNIALLKALISIDSDKTKYLNEIQLDLNKAYSRFSFTVFKAKEGYAEKDKNAKDSTTKDKFAEWSEQQKVIKKRIDTLILDLNESDLKSDWDEIFLQNNFGLNEKNSEIRTDIIGLFTPADEIAIPKRLMQVEKDNLSEKEQGTIFRRLLHRSQDALVVEEYEKAYDYCLQIRDRLEPESAQLYEYLLLIFTKKNTPKKIVQEILEEEKETLLNYLVLYTGRYFQFHRDNKCQSLTGENNILEIIESLSNSLRDSYSNLPGGYVFEDESKHIDSKAKVKKTIDAALKIFYSIPDAPTMSFLKQVVINELSGGGKFSWIEINEETDDGWSLKDKVSKIHYSALTKLDEINIIYKEKEGNTFKLENLISKSLLPTLDYKYQQIQEEFNKKKYLNADDLDFFIAALIRLINAYKIGFELSNKDENFLSTPLIELEGDGIVQWFTFDDSGKLTAIREALQKGFSAFNELKRLMNIKYKKDKEGEVYLRIKKATYNRLTKETAHTYQNLQSKANRGIIFSEDQKIVAKCIRDWWVYHKVYNDNEMLDKCLHELSGEGIFLWFEATESEMTVNKDGQQLKYIYDEIKLSLPNKKDEINRKAFFENIAKNLFHKLILKEYNKISINDITSRIEIFKLLIHAKNCYKNISSYPDLVDFMYGELINERKFQWFDIGEEGIIVFWGAFIEELNYLDKMPDFLDVFFSIDFYANNIKKAISTKRYLAMKQQYESEVLLSRRQNQYAEMRVALKMLRKARQCFLVYPNIRFLEEAKKEISGKGRIRWYRRFYFRKDIYIEWATWKSMELHDEFSLERKQLREILKKIELREIEFVDEPLSTRTSLDFDNRLLD